MSFSKTYTHTVLIGLDQFGAAVIFNRNDLTISTMCDMVMKGNDASLELHGWQRAFLKMLGPRLNRIQADHCGQARLGDEQRAKLTLQVLGTTG